MEYRYHLIKYKGKASRLTCPNCGRPHCFSPYVDADEQIVGVEYGRCDYESSCGYVKYPPSEYDPFKRRNSSSEDWRKAPEWLKRSPSGPKPRVIAKPQPKPEQKDDICTIPMDIVLKTIRTRPLSDFLKFLLTIIDVDTIVRWLATGGKGQLNDRVEALDGRTIIAFPDVDGYDIWVTKAAERPYLNIAVSDLLEKNATQEDRDAHIDIADILIRRQLRTPSYSVPKPQAPPPDELYADNPVMREVMKYISPEHWDTVAALIEEFDLEFLGVTRKIME